MAKQKEAAAAKIETALAKVYDEKSFIQTLLIDTLEWPIDTSVHSVADIAYDWEKDELKADGLDKRVVDGKVRQLALPGCPWGIFIVEFKNPDALSSGRGMTGPLRQILAGLVPRQRKAAHLPSFFREHLLFICTHNYQYFRFVHFRDPGASFKQPTLASFGWWPGDSTKTVSTYNLPHLKFLSTEATVDDWLAEWTSAFDVERVTKQFYENYEQIHELFRDELKGVPDPAERTWLASVVLNRLMFVYFLQKKGFLDDGDEAYLEQKLKAEQAHGKNRYYANFLTLLFFEGFAKPEEKRSPEAKAKLGKIRYLNGGLFLKHRIELDAEKVGRTVSLPDSVFAALFKLFASFSWNLNDKPGGQDNEINPDVLGYIVEKYINQKAFGAYYTRPEITGYLCERTIHRLILDAINTPESAVASAQKAGLPVRSYKTVAELLKKLDPALATKLLDDVLPNLALLDPACGSGAFLVAAMKTLIDVYAAIFGWIKFNGSPALKSRLKQIETDHPALDYFIKKRIITDNLYGVDIMEEAVEIARLRLFLALASSANIVEELEPLPNIDFNVLRGNSLIGLMHVDPKGFDQKNLFLPPYEQVLKERDRQLDTYRHATAFADDLTALREKIAAVNAKAQERLNDLLLAEFHSLGIKYEQATWDDKKNVESKPVKRQLTLDDMDALQPFHWAFAFDKVMARGGFDAIITNPPWEVFKPNGKEFFEQHSELVSKKRMTIHDFQAERKKLLKDVEVRDAWLRYLGGFEHQNQYFRNAPEYAKQTPIVDGKKVPADVNLYKLFVERCFRLLRAGGQCGMIVAASVYNDLGAKDIRSLLLDDSQLWAMIVLSNERRVFEGVHHDFKFCILDFTKGSSTTSFRLAFRVAVSEAVHPNDIAGFLDNNASYLHLSRALVRRFSPDSLSIMDFRLQHEIDTVERMFRFPLLRDQPPGSWGLRLCREFHMTDDADLYESTPGPAKVRLVEGKTIHQFTDTWQPAKYWVSFKAGSARLLASRIRAIAVLARRVGLPVPAADPKLDCTSYRLAYRDVGTSTNERSMIATVLPPRVFCPHTTSLEEVFAPMVSDDSIDPNVSSLNNIRRLYLCGVLNSFVIDHWVKRCVSKHVSFFYVYQLPVPRLDDGAAPLLEIAQRAARLICTNREFDALAHDARLMPPDHRAGVTDPAARLNVRAELDAMAAHLYHLTDEEFAHILSTFPLVPDDLKQAALAEFSRMLETGEAAVFNPELAKPVFTPAEAVAVDPVGAVKALIAAGESATVEFKSTARFDVKQAKPAPYIERVIVKTVAAFLNTAGGTLVIGVDDNGAVYGLAEDYMLCGNKGRDGFEQWLMQTLLKDFGKDAAGQLAVAFHQLVQPAPATDGQPAFAPGSGDICVMTVGRSPRPRFVVENGQELFYIRTGNATNQLKPSELLPYCNARWPGGIAEPEQPEEPPEPHPPAADPAPPTAATATEEGRRPFP